MMETVVLNNGVQMPAADSAFFQIADEAQCIQTVCHAIEAGYRLIDTAQSYGNEIAVGKAIRTSTVQGRTFLSQQKSGSAMQENKKPILLL